MAKIEPPSSLTTTIVRSGRGSSGPITRPLVSCRNVTSPISASARVAVRAAERGADRGRDRAVDAGEAAVGDAPCGGRRRRTRATIRSRSRIGLEAPTTSSPPGGSGAADRPGDLVRREVGLGGQQRVEPAGDRRRSAARQSLEPGRVVGARPAAARRTSRSSTGNGRVGQTPRAGGVDHLDVVAARAAGCTGRDRVGCPQTTTRSTCAAEVAVEQQPVGADRVGRRCASRWTARRAAASRRPGRAPAPAARRRRRRPRRCAGRAASVGVHAPGRTALPGSTRA